MGELFKNYLETPARKKNDRERITVRKHTKKYVFYNIFKNVSCNNLKQIFIPSWIDKVTILLLCKMNMFL